MKNNSDQASSDMTNNRPMEASIQKHQINVMLCLCRETTLKTYRKSSPLRQTRFGSLAKYSFDPFSGRLPHLDKDDILQN